MFVFLVTKVTKELEVVTATYKSHSAEYNSVILNECCRLVNWQPRVEINIGLRIELIVQDGRRISVSEQYATGCFCGGWICPIE